MTTRLIVGFDGSDQSRTALEWAACEAERRHAAIRVITAFAAPPVASYYAMGSGVYSPEQFDGATEKYRQQALGAVAKTIAEHPTAGIDIEVVDAFPADAILHAATTDDLIVVGSSGAGVVKSFILDSVVASVLHQSPCPVVVVPEKLQPRVGRIAVGVDGSPASDNALTWAATEAQLLSSDLVVAHGWEYPYRLTEEGFAHGCDAAQVDAAIVLDRAIESVRNLTTVPIERRLLEGGTVQSLLDLSAEMDLMVLGSRGRGGFRSMVLGSVAIAIAAHARSPVAVIPAR